MPDTRDAIRTLIKGLNVGLAVSDGTSRLKVTQSQALLQNVVQGRVVRDAAGRFAGYKAYEGREVEVALQHLATQIMGLLEQNIQRLTGSQYRTLSALAYLGHPYSKRHRTFSAATTGTPGPQYVNRQTGAFAGGFAYSLATPSPGGMFSILATNGSEESKLLATGTTGKRAMIARPFDRAAVDMTRGEAQADIERTAELITKLGGDASLAHMPVIAYNLDGLRRSYPAGGR